LINFPQTAITRNPGDIFEAARRGPVAIARHERSTFVIMTYGRLERLDRLDSRWRHFIEEAPPELIDEAEAALNRFEAEGDA